MKILVISQYYPPEPGATSNRLEAFVQAMVSRGHEVTVICEFPNHPTGRLLPGDRWRLFRVENKGTHKIIRTFVLTFTRKNNVKRMLFYLSFALSSFIAGILLGRRDVIFSSSPPTFHVYTSMIVAKVKRSKFVLDIRDLLSEAALEIGAVTNNRLIKWGGDLERKLYLGADVIFAISRGLKNKIEKRGGAGKCHIIYNGSSEDILLWNGDTDELRRSLGWGEKIVVAYTGLIGLPQDLIRLLPEIVQVDNERILFAFIGDGPGKEPLEQAAKKIGIKKIFFYDHMPRSEVIPLTHAADITTVILRELDFFKSAIPSKFFDCMAAAKPVVTNVDGELREIMEQNNTGLYFSYNKEGSFAKAIKMLAENAELRKSIGENGKKLVYDRFLRKKLADEGVEIIENAVKC